MKGRIQWHATAQFYLARQTVEWPDPRPAGAMGHSKSVSLGILFRSTPQHVEIPHSTLSVLTPLGKAAFEKYFAEQ